MYKLHAQKIGQTRFLSKKKLGVSKMGFWSDEWIRDEVRKRVNEIDGQQLEKKANKQLQQLLKHREMLNNEFIGSQVRREMPTLEQDIEQLEQALKKRDHDKIKRLVNNLQSLKQVEKIESRAGTAVLLFAGPILVYIACFIFLIMLLVFFLL